MDDKAAKDLLKETFGKTYDLDRFRAFVRELSKGYEPRERPIQISANFESIVKSAFRVGKFSCSHNNNDEIDILVVKLQKEGSLGKARTAQRNFIARHLEVRKKEAALVAFVSPDSSSWRFSLVRREVGLTRNKKGKTKTKIEFSPARRFSFWVGQGERTHTTQKQFLELLKSDAKPSLKSLEKAFDIETVTNAFFEEYRDLFNNLNDKIKEYLSQNPTIENHFKEKDIETSDFAKRLLGQIVFLYFLQKKGWLGVAKGKKWGEGDKEFLQTIYKNCETQGKNFFHDYLQPLFYSALNKDNSEVDHYNATFECRIPYLNGGLFEPFHDYDWVNQEIKLPNTLFQDLGTTLLWEDGKGILNVFDRYNFTVAEDEPLEREVAIDPEMLGKVFEKLLPVKERGNLGTFYTPREIVHYMCQESLIAFLSSRFPNIDKEELADFVHHCDLYTEFDTEILLRQAEGKNPTKDYSECLTPKSIRDAAKQIDTALENIKVCDPAVGSGAFPVGMMMEIIRIRKVLGLFTNEPQKTNYDLKRKTIQESLYGVDLDAGAVEIAKLRLWLSLVVDEDNFDEIKALPNLDYKIMQGNSLLQTYEGISLFDDSMLADVDHVKKRREQLQAEFKAASEQYIDEISKDVRQTTKLKREQLEKAVRAKKKELDDFAKEEQNMQTMPLFEDHSKAHKLSEQLKAKHKEFFNETYPRNKKKLKAEIDALEWELIEASLKEANKQDKIDDIKKLQRHNTRPYFLWKLQFNDVFSGENAGFDIVVANPPYVRHEKIKSQKPGLKAEFGEFYCGTADLYTYFFKRGSEILKPNGHLCFIAPNKFFRANYGRNLCSFLKYDLSLKMLIDFKDLPIFDATTYPSIIMGTKAKPIYEHKFMAAQFASMEQVRNIATQFQELSYEMENEELDDDGWLIDSPEINGLRRKLRRQGVPLFEFVEGRLNRGVLTGLNEAFVINSEIRDKLIGEDPNCESIIKPWLRGKDIKRWEIEYSNLYVIFAKQGINIEEFPSVERYLKNFQEDLMPREKSEKNENENENLKQKKGRKHGNYKWYELQDNVAYWRDFEVPKIAWGNLATKPKFTYIEDCYYISAPSNLIPTQNLSLLAILNSPVCSWLILKAAAERAGGFLEFKPMYVGRIPIPPADEQTSIVLSKTVRTILDLKAHNSDADVSDLERQINDEIYRLYNLTPEEIAIIESSVQL